MSSNIQIHGRGERKADSLKKKIDKAMKGIGFEHKVITTISKTKAESCDGTKASRPYLRIFCENKKDGNEIIKGLKKAGIYEDTEKVPMEFITKEEMEEMKKKK